MDLKSFTSAVAQIAEEKGVSYEKVVGVIEAAIATAYKKDFGKKGQVIRSKLNPETGKVKFSQVQLVVDESMLYSEEELEAMAKNFSSEKDEFSEEEKKVRFNSEKHIMIDDAKKINSKISVGEELIQELKTKEDYGRIAAQTARQVVLQKLKEAERDIVFEEYKSKEGEVISGIVQRIEGQNIFFDVGKATGFLTKDEHPMGEFYRIGQRVKVYVVKVEQTPKGAMVFLSRSYPKIVSKLFELEVPEISSGSVIVNSIAREAGSRSKIAVSSNTEGVDPIGSMVGQRGIRVFAVINELGGEKIDVIEWSEDPEKYIANSLSPAKILEVKILPKNKALVIVPEDQLSLAIGKEGQNVRLAAKLTGWKIDVIGPGGDKTEEEKEETRDTTGDKKGGIINKKQGTKDKDEDKDKNEDKNKDKNKDKRGESIVAKNHKKEKIKTNELKQKSKED
ncbi:MAG: transcription termination factor NusA [Patescibacteria group bacterium]|nr:transcription termination factor NusA [Patescibacteria group bacterium]